MGSRDVVIVGAGIIGLSVALQLARRAAGKILVLEKGFGLGEGSTGASSAVCRFRYSHDAMVELARDGIAAYRDWADFLGIGNPVAAYQRTGVVWLDEDLGGQAPAEVERLAQLGVTATELSAAELQERFPALSRCVVAPDLIAGEPHDCRPARSYLLEEDGGYMEPTDALQDLLAAVRARDVEVRFGTRVTGIELVSGRTAAVTLSDGTHVGCGTVVNASGPWCNELLETVGLDDRWPLVPTRIQIAQVDLPRSLPGRIPVCGDLPAGIYFRPQGAAKHLIVGSVLPSDEREAVPDPDDFDRSADEGFVRSKLHALQHRIPALADLRGVRGYSGLYTMNLADVHPIVGSTPIDGLFVANGCSGHGFKLAPAIGSLIAQAVTGERLAFDTAVDPHFLAFDREPLHLESRSVLA